MDRHVDLVIIGAGTAGLSAFKEAVKFSKNIVIVDKGPLGTTCARIGCMPSKVLLQAAAYFHQRHHFSKMGIHGADKVSIDIPEVLAYVRSMRDYFTKGVIEFTKSLDEKFICGEARLLTATSIAIGTQTIHAKAIIIATGSHSIIPAAWHSFKDKILTSENIFEQKNLAEKIAVIGAGSIGLEFGQALSRFGIDISVYNAGAQIGGLTDPAVNAAAIKIFRAEFPVIVNEEASLSLADNRILINGKKKSAALQVIAAMGRAANVADSGLENLDIARDENGLPVYDKTTMQIAGTTIFIAGDANKSRPLLHEAADEGRIAGFNALNPTRCFQRRTPLAILFTEPNIAVIGKSFSELDSGSIVIGEVDFSSQGRAKVMSLDKGLLRIYGSKTNGALLGAELIAPDGEHIAHLLAWAISKEMTVFDILQLPFYHPAIEEGMRTALRDLGRQVELQSQSFELAMCDSEAIHPLS